jgi:RNA polymerase sigma-70 factor (ECF subfamily)
VEFDRLPDQSDTKLIRGLRRGEVSAFHELVDCYANRLFGLAYSMLGSAEDAEDAVQETLAGAFRAIAAFEQRSSLWTWLARILVRQVARVRRSTRSIRLTPVEIAEDESAEQMSSRHPVASPLAGVDAKIDVAAALAELESDHRQIIVLRELQQMSYSQISQVLGIPLGTVESRLFRARDELRKLLKDWK